MTKWATIMIGENEDWTGVAEIELHEEIDNLCELGEHHGFPVSGGDFLRWLDSIGIVHWGQSDED
jgi:hypothetical protein